LAEDVAVALLRVAQEALANVHKHARAKHVWIKLSRSHGHLSLRIEDDGIGIAPLDRDTPSGVGLPGMEARLRHFGGSLSLRKRRNGGTVVEALVPLQ
jgi:signal transduction histidine kinase